jgi:hypothetical protein
MFKQQIYSPFNADGLLLFFYQTFTHTKIKSTYNLTLAPKIDFIIVVV